MKNSKKRWKRSRVLNVTSKLFACMLSIMLVLTVIMPALATENKISKQDDKKIAKSGALHKWQSKTSKRSGEKIVAYGKKEKPNSDESKRDVSSKDKKDKKKKAVSKPKTIEGKEGAKEDKVKNKRNLLFNLNESGNVKATRDLENNINVLARDTSGDMKIDRQKWIDMVVALGGVHNADGLNWGKVNVGRLKFHTAGISLPDDCSTFFRFFKGEIYGCESLNTSDVINMSFMFRWTAKADPNVSNWDTSKVTDMEGMFLLASANPDVSKWNTSNVTNMKGMFDRAGNADPDVSNWDTSKVTDMEDMFSGVVNGNPDVSNWDTSSVTDMQSMFFRTEKANPDVSKWNISNVTNMYEMFQEAKAANPEVSNWDTSKVENMSRMFYFASNATPNVKNWNTPNVTDMSGMFKGAEKANPDVSNWDISNVTDMKDMFSGSGIKKADLSKWKLNKDGSNGTLQSGHMFDGCEALEYLKTPAGLGTIVKGGNYDFKIIRLKKGDPVTIEKENQNFGGMESAYVINAADDKEAVYHVYRKDKYVGVTFDKNGGDTECWFNHEIVEKGKTFNAGGGRFPSQKPTKKEHVCVGWAKNAKATKPNIIKNTVVDKDVTAYAVYKLEVPKLKMKVRVKKIRKGRKRIKVRVLTLRFRPSKAASGYEAKVVIRGKVRKIKLKKGRKKLKGFIVGKITLPLKGEVFFRLRGFKKVKGKRHYGIMLYKNIYWLGTKIIPPASSDII